MAAELEHRLRKSRVTSTAAGPEPAPGKEILTANMPAVAGSSGGTNGIYAPAAGMWALPAAPSTPIGATAATGMIDGDDSVLAETIIAGYRAAQHELDSESAPSQALEHLRHILNVVPEYRGKAGFESVWAAADSFQQALERRSRKAPRTYRQLDDFNKRIRDHLGLTGASKPRLDLSSGSHGEYAKAAITPALDVLALHARDGLKALDSVAAYDQAARLRVVDRLAGDIGFTSEYVLRCLQQVPAEERSAVVGAANGAISAIGKLLRWVRARPAHEQLERTLVGSGSSNGVSAFDALLAALGVPSLGERAEAPLTENQRHSAEEEHADFDQALSEAIGAIEDMTRLQQRKIELFQQLAALDDQPEPDFKTSLMNAIIEATLSMIIGQFAKAITTAPPQVQLPVPAGAVSLPPPPREPGSGGVLENLNTVVSIKLGALRSAITTQLSAPIGGGIDPRKRALFYFCDGMRAAEDARAQQYISNLGTLKKRSSITASDLRGVTQLISFQKEALAQHAVEQMAKSWAQYLVRSRLGTTNVGNEKVTKMHDYFGEKTAGGRAYGTTHSGGDGVLSVTMNVENGKPTVDPASTKLIGLNSELQEHVLSAANFDFARVDVPKEVHINARFARATIALDETNHIRDVLGWESVQRYVGGLSAAAFWQTWGHNLKVNHT